jgi:hypothetical protein
LYYRKRSFGKSTDAYYAPTQTLLLQEAAVSRDVAFAACFKKLQNHAGIKNLLAEIASTASGNVLAFFSEKLNRRIVRRLSYAISPQYQYHHSS